MESRMVLLENKFSDMDYLEKNVAGLKKVIEDKNEKFNDLSEKVKDIEKRFNTKPVWSCTSLSVDRAQTLFFILHHPRLTLQGSKQTVLPELFRISASLELTHVIS